MLNRNVLKSSTLSLWMRTVRLRDIQPLLQGHQVEAELDSNACNWPEAVAWAPALYCPLVWRLRVGGRTSSAHKYIWMFVARWKCEHSVQRFFLFQRSWESKILYEMASILNMCFRIWALHVKEIPGLVWPLTWTFWVCSHGWSGPGVEFHADKIAQKMEAAPLRSIYVT